MKYYNKRTNKQQTGSVLLTMDEVATSAAKNEKVGEVAAAAVVVAGNGAAGATFTATATAATAAVSAASGSNGSTDGGSASTAATALLHPPPQSPEQERNKSPDGAGGISSTATAALPSPRPVGAPEAQQPLSPRLPPQQHEEPNKRRRRPVVSGCWPLRGILPVELCSDLLSLAEEVPTEIYTFHHELVWSRLNPSKSAVERISNSYAIKVCPRLWERWSKRHGKARHKVRWKPWLRRIRDLHGRIERALSEHDGVRRAHGDVFPDSPDRIRWKYLQLLVSEPGSMPQILHADDSSLSALVVNVYLRDRSAPTEIVPGMPDPDAYDADNALESYRPLLDPKSENLMARLRPAVDADEVRAGDGVAMPVTQVHRGPGNPFADGAGDGGNDGDNGAATNNRNSNHATVVGTAPVPPAKNNIGEANSRLQPNRVILFCADSPVGDENEYGYDAEYQLHPLLLAHRLWANVQDVMERVRLIEQVVANWSEFGYDLAEHQSFVLQN